MLPRGLATLAAAGVGALAARSPAMLRTQLLMIAVGALLAAVGTFREGGFAAAAFGLAPTALGGAALALAGRARGAAAIVALAAAALLAASAVIRAVYGTVQTPEPVTHRPVSVATGVALALLVALTVAAGPAFDFATRTARELLDRHAYVAALSPSSARR